MDHSGNELVGPLSEWVLENLLWFFNFPDTGLILASALAGLALLVALAVLYESYFDCAWRIERANKLLRAINGKREFSRAEVYERLTAKIKSDELLRQAWQEFDETMVRPEEVEKNFKGQGRFRLSTRRPHEYFNTQVIAKTNVQPMVHSGAFVGVGLLITFVGLVAALTASATAFTADTGTGDQIEAAIGELLVVAGSKFFASIGGLIGSMLVAMGCHLGRSRIASAFADMNALLEERLVFVSQTEALIAQYKYAVNQSETLSKMKDELVADLGTQLGEQMKEAVHAIPPMLKSALDPMNNSIGLMSDELIKNAQQTSGKVAQSAADNMLGAMQDGLATLGTQLSEMGRNMDGISAGLRDRLNGFNKSIGDMEDKQSGQTDKMVSDLDAATRAMSEMFKQTLGSFEKGFGGAADALATSADKSAQRFSEGYDEMARKLRTELDGAAEQIADSLKDNVDQVLTALRDELKDQGAELVSGVKTWAETSRQTSSALAQVNEALNQNRSSLELSAKVVGEGGSSLQKVLVTLSPVVSALERGASQIETTSTIAKEAIQALQADVAGSKAAVEELKAQWERQGHLLKANDEQLERAFTQVARGSEASLEVLKASSEEIDKLSSKINEHFKSIVSELADAIADLSDGNNKGER